MVARDWPAVLDCNNKPKNTVAVTGASNSKRQQQQRASPATLGWLGTVGQLESLLGFVVGITVGPSWDPSWDCPSWASWVDTLDPTGKIQLAPNWLSQLSQPRILYSDEGSDSSGCVVTVCQVRHYTLSTTSVRVYNSLNTPTPS